MTKGYEFDFVTGVLTVTATFMKKASTNIRSEEYSILKQYKKDFPELKVEIAKANSNNGEKRLTYPQMKSFIKMNYTDGVELTEEQIAENKRIDALVAEFDRMKQLSKIHKNPYNFVFSWFKSSFPNYKSADAYKALLTKEELAKAEKAAEAAPADNITEQNEAA